MRWIVLASLMLGAWGMAGCERRSPEAELAWVENADPTAMFEDSSRAGRLHLLEVCGYACVSPGIGEIAYDHCYARSIDRVIIDHTYDVIVSRRHEQLKNKAYQFALRYNALVKTKLDDNGRRHCPPAARWDEYWQALESLAVGIPAHPYKSFVLSTYRAGSSSPDFQLHVQDERDLAFAGNLRPRMCALAERYGITAEIRFAVSSGNINEHPKAQPGFTCRGGDVVG